MVLNSVSFCLSEKLLISPSNLNEILAGQSNLGCRFFSFITLSISCPSLLACRVSAEKSADNLMGIPLYVIFCFSLVLLIFFLNFIYLFIYSWLCWVFVSVRGLSLVVASGGHSSSRCVGLSLAWPLLLQSTGSRRAGSAIVARGLSRSAACGIFPDQGSNPCPLHWQANSQPLCHQGSPNIFSLNLIFVSLINMCLGVFYPVWDCVLPGLG